MKRKIPINRLNKWYDNEDFEFDKDLGREYLENDLNFTVVLYRVDRVKTGVDEYGESGVDEIRYLPPVELKVNMGIAEPKTGTLDKGRVQRQWYGNMTLHVYIDELLEKNVDITIGDYIGYADRPDNVKFFQVVDDGRIYSDFDHTIGGFQGFYRTILAVPVDNDEFTAI